MAIKLQSQKVLLTLFPGENQSNQVIQLEQARGFFPQLTANRFHSLITHLSTKGLIRHERVGKTSQLYLSETGKKTLHALFPALDPSRRNWNGNWSCLVFQEAPKGDRAFRYLRRKLVELGALQLTRGVYLYPNKFPEVFLEQCSKLYAGAVLIVSIGSVQFGELRPIVLEKGNLSTIIDLYSGISSEIDQLLAQIDDDSLLTDQQKELFTSLFDRYTAILREDIGLGTYFFPDETWGEETLQSLRSIVLL